MAGVLLGDHLISSHAYDQNHYHIQVVRQFEAQWPLSFELSDHLDVIVILIVGMRGDQMIPEKDSRHQYQQNEDGRPCG